MRFRIREGRDAAAELERIAHGLAEPPSTKLDGKTRVHEFRKHCKKLRAIARLAGRKADNRRFRDLARRFSGARDAAVMLATFDSMTEPGEFPELRERLERPADDVVPEIPRIDLDWNLSGLDIGKACRKFYRAARRAYRAAAAEPVPERVHEWRKRVKDHWYHMRLLGHPRKAPLGELSELLGDANDLAVLHARVDEVGAGEELLPRIDRRRRELVARAFRLGEELFEAKPWSAL